MTTVKLSTTFFVYRGLFVLCGVLCVGFFSFLSLKVVTLGEVLDGSVDK